MINAFSFLQYDFMVLALVAIALLSPLFGLMGTMIVTRKMAFFSDALGHSAITGIAVGLVLSVKDVNISMIAFAIIFAIVLNEIGRRVSASRDTIISVFSSASLALGLAILSRGGNFSKYSAMLVGDILSISEKEVVYLGVMLVITLVFWIVFGNKLQAMSFHEPLAKSRNYPVALLENIFAVLVALVVMVSIKWVGILIINALLILPAASSANVSDNLREYHLFSVIFAYVSGFVGLVSSYYTGVATGPMIVLVAATIYFGSYFYGKNRN